MGPMGELSKAIFCLIFQLIRSIGLPLTATCCIYIGYNNAKIIEKCDKNLPFKGYESDREECPIILAKISYYFILTALFFVPIIMLIGGVANVFWKVSDDLKKIILYTIAGMKILSWLLAIAGGGTAIAFAVRSGEFIVCKDFECESKVGRWKSICEDNEKLCGRIKTEWFQPLYFYIGAVFAFVYVVVEFFGILVELLADTVHDAAPQRRNQTATAARRNPFITRGRW